MTIEQLTKRRYKVIAQWPLCPYELNSIIDECCMKGSDTCYYDEWPHLFRKLEWWEERKAEDMPAYVKCLKSPDQIIEPGSVLKVAWNDHGGKVEKGPWIFPYTNCYEPSTESEYLTYINSKK